MKKGRHKRKNVHAIVSTGKKKSVAVELRAPLFLFISPSRSSRLLHFREIIVDDGITKRAASRLIVRDEISFQKAFAAQFAVEQTFTLGLFPADKLPSYAVESQASDFYEDAMSSRSRTLCSLGFKFQSMSMTSKATRWSHTCLQNWRSLRNPRGRYSSRWYGQ